MCRTHRTCLALVVCAAVLAAPLASAQWTTQTIQLNPGWNAVFLEVTPSPNDTASVFEGVPVESVWAWNKQFSTVQYIQDPESLVPEQPEWLTWFPPESPDAFLSDLAILRGGQAYLVKLAAGATVNWEVKGRPAYRTAQWLSESFNLVGFHVDDGAQVTLGQFFAVAPTLAGQKIHRLSSAGIWEEVATPSTVPIERGRAYWVYSNGPSDFQGLLSVTLEDRQSVDFGRLLAEREIIIENARADAVQVTITPRASETPPQGEAALAGGVPLSWFRMALDQETMEWAPLQDSLSVQVPGQGQRRVRLAVRRADMAAYTPAAADEEFLYQSFLDVRDAAGNLVSLGVTSEGLQTEVPEAFRHGAKADDLTALFGDQNAGLWYGYVTVKAVSNALSAATSFADPPEDLTDSLPEGEVDDIPVVETDGKHLPPRKEPALQRAVPGGEPLPTTSEFVFPIIVHVDYDGQARLLSEVTVMWKDGATQAAPDNPEYETTALPGEYVLITRGDLLGQFKGSTVRDGEQVGRRIASANFSHGAPVDMNGDFGGTLGCTLDIPHDDPLNPFKHRYHPDHDMEVARMTTRSDGSQAPWYTVTRELELTFSDTDPESNDTARWGDSLTGGVYDEAVIGIHKETIHVQGLFRLYRVADVGVLNDGIE